MLALVGKPAASRLSARYGSRGHTCPCSVKVAPRLLEFGTVMPMRIGWPGRARNTGVAGSQRGSAGVAAQFTPATPAVIVLLNRSPAFSTAPKQVSWLGSPVNGTVNRPAGPPAQSAPPAAASGEMPKRKKVGSVP